MISVINVRGLTPNKSGVWYVGRSCAGWNGSPLANPFHIGKDGSREEVIEKYRQWLRAEYRKDGAVRAYLHMLAVKERHNEKIVLGCWCAPQACHAEFIREAILKIVEKWNQGEWEREQEWVEAVNKAVSDKHGRVV